MRKKLHDMAGPLRRGPENGPPFPFYYQVWETRDTHMRSTLAEVSAEGMSTIHVASPPLFLREPS